MNCCKLLMTAFMVHGKKASWEPFTITHPLSQWVASSYEAFAKTRILANSLCIEYTVRFNKRHLVTSLLREELSESPMSASLGYLTPPPYIGPERYWGLVPAHIVGWDRVVDAYRLYYYHGLGSVCVWSRREQPWWWHNTKDNTNGLE